MKLILLIKKYTTIHFRRFHSKCKLDAKPRVNLFNVTQKPTFGTKIKFA